jgi:hypothetical protein
MCQLGATDTDLARAFKVSESTISMWKVTHAEFSEALTLGKDCPNDRVEASLYHRAIGYSHVEDDIRVINNEIVITKTRKHYPPDTKAALAWLYNRRPDKWHPLGQQGEGDGVGEAILNAIRNLPN